MDLLKKEGIVETIFQKIKNDKKLFSNIDDLKVDNILIGTSYYRKSDFVEPFSDHSYYMVILAGHILGFSYFNSSFEEKEILLNYIDKNVIELLHSSKIHYPLKIAMFDALVGIYNNRNKFKPSKSEILSGTYYEKSKKRAKLLTSNLGGLEKVLLAGAVPEIAKEILKRNCSLKITDLSYDIRDRNIYEVPVNSNMEDTLNYIRSANVAIVTGATFSSNSIDSILKIGKENNTELYFYLETANNLGYELIENGASFVLAEKFPFYDFPGITKVEIYKK